jgi:transposase
MARKHPPYAPEFRRQMDRACSSRSGTPEELAKEFEPSAQTIRNWVAQADRKELEQIRCWTARTCHSVEELRDRLRRGDSQL